MYKCDSEVDEVFQPPGEAIYDGKCLKELQYFRELDTESLVTIWRVLFRPGGQEQGGGDNYGVYVSALTEMYKYFRHGLNGPTSRFTRKDGQ